MYLFGCLRGTLFILKVLGSCFVSSKTVSYSDWSCPKVRGHGVAVLSLDDSRGSFEETFFNNNHSILVMKINVKSTTSEHCTPMEQLSRNLSPFLNFQNV